MVRHVGGLEIKRALPVHRQITEHVRQLIAEGGLKAGQRLPPIKALAAQWGTNYFTAHLALTPLVNEGLLERKRKVGTFVRGNGARWTGAGIYFGGDIWSSSESGFFQTLYRTLQTKLTEERVRPVLWIDSRLPDIKNKPMPALIKGVRAREVQCVIAAMVDPSECAWLDQLPVPTAILTAVEVSRRVHFDFKQMMQVGLRCLKGQGCRSVGLISSVPTRFTSLDGRPTNFSAFYQHFTETAKRLGLRTQDGWVRGANPPAESVEAFGYQQFRELWAKPSRPEGLIVWPDTAARGVITAILERRVRVPEDLSLVLHRNAEMPFVCPLPAYWLVSTAMQVAEALIRQVRTRNDAAPVHPLLLPFTLIEETPHAGRTAGNATVTVP